MIVKKVTDFSIELRFGTANHRVINDVNPRLLVFGNSNLGMCVRNLNMEKEMLLREIALVFCGELANYVHKNYNRLAT